MITNVYSTHAYAARDPRSLLHRDATLDVVYSVHSESKASRGINVVFMHGAQYTRAIYLPHIELLQKRLGAKLGKCISIDHVFAGDSAVLNEGKIAPYITWEDLGNDAACVIEDCILRGEISRHEPLVVLGHSMGGFAAMVMCVCHPHLASGLVVIDPTFISNMPLEMTNDARLRTGRLSLAALRRARDSFSSFDEYKKYMDTESLVAKCDPRVRDAMTASNYIVHPDGTVTTKSCREQQVSPYTTAYTTMGTTSSFANRIRQPSLLIHGNIYDFNPEGHVAGLESLIRASQLDPVVKRVEIKGSKHDVMLTHVEETVDAWVPFFTDVADRFAARQAELEKSYDKSFVERYYDLVKAKL